MKTVAGSSGTGRRHSHHDVSRPVVWLAAVLVVRDGIVIIITAAAAATAVAVPLVHTAVVAAAVAAAAYDVQRQEQRGRPISRTTADHAAGRCGAGPSGLDWRGHRGDYKIIFSKVLYPKSRHKVYVTLKHQIKYLCNM